MKFHNEIWHFWLYSKTGSRKGSCWKNRLAVRSFLKGKTPQKSHSKRSPNVGTRQRAMKNGQKAFPHPGNTKNQHPQIEDDTSSFFHEVEIASYNHDPSFELDPTRDGSQVALPLAAKKSQRDMTSNRPVKIGWISLGNLKIWSRGHNLLLKHLFLKRSKFQVLKGICRFSFFHQLTNSMACYWSRMPNPQLH